MKRLFAAMFVSLLFSACELGTGRPAPKPQQTPGVMEQAMVYAAVIQRLVTRDHTLGHRASPFEHVYIVDGAVEDAGKVPNGLRPAHQPFPEKLKQALIEELDGLPPLDFILHPDRVRLGRQGGGGVKNGGVIITLGPIERQGTQVHVGNGLWCGGTCGQWQTYVLNVKNGVWRVTGTTGLTTVS